MANFDFNFYTINQKYNGARGQIALRIRNKSFDEAIKLAHRCSNAVNPIVKMQFDNFDTLYFDDHTIELYINKEISYQELIAGLSCKDVVVNKFSVTTEDNERIDMGSLWKKFETKCVLIDDDRYIEAEFNNKIFDVVEFS